MEHEEQAQRMERDAGRMEDESERVGEHIDEARRDWDAKEQDPAVPGAQPDPEEEEEGVTETPREESDQLPEEGPSEQVHDYAGATSHREAEDTPGVPGEEGTATGNPEAAGAED
ncbi:MAG: hypothetical protein ACRDL0_12310 [Thermoleophilaceae bacterium]